MENKMIRCLIAAGLAVSLAAAPALAATPREMLATAALQVTSRDQALGLVNQALSTTQAQLAANPADKEAQIQHAVAVGDHAKLTRSPAEAKQARALFEAYAAANPRDSEAQFAIACWHLDTLAAGFLATTVLGAKKEVGLGALNRAVALSGGRPFITGFAALLRIRYDPADVAAALQLAQTAVVNPAPTPLDRYGQKAAQAVLAPLKAGDGKSAAALARSLLPFGRLG
jgi:hypothetical protein